METKETKNLKGTKMLNRTAKQSKDIKLARTNLEAFGVDLNKVKEYIETRIGIDLYTQDATPSGRHNDPSYVCLSYEVNIKDIGLMKFAIQKIWLLLEFHLNEENKKYYVNPSFRYEHHNGGGNGHELNFSLVGHVGQGSNNRLVERV